MTARPATRACAAMLRGHRILVEDARAVVDGYTRQCSVLVSTRDLAMMAATLAYHGMNPLSGEQVVPKPVVRQVLSVMFSCGMCDAAGDWGTQVGIPAKSGVAGGLIGALPAQIGIAASSPRPDCHGNSVRGVSLSERFSSDMGLHVMEVPATARATLRTSQVVSSGPHTLRALQLQGGMGFVGAERIVGETVDTSYAVTGVALDLTRVHSVDDVARRVLTEVMRRLMSDGHEVYLVDPDSVMPAPDPGEGGRVTVVNSLDEAVAAQEGLPRARLTPA
ncbi:glutaminase [Streptomyces sp. CS131]|uniref:glutaminase n=1 Tax=Streptomyces sp. CS131 TaxID=2162711 RepID=UPI0023B7DA42|nr:glutaminase [Streptomyces sp. CS131]